MEPWSWHLLTSVLTIVGAGAAAYYGAYFKKRAEDDASKVSIGDLTRIVKGIEGKVSHEYWTTQRGLEIRKEVIFDAVREFSKLQQAVYKLLFTYDSSKDTPDDGSRLTAITTYNSCISSFWGAQTLLSLVCSEEMTALYKKVSDKVLFLANEPRTPFGTSTQDIVVDFKELTVMLAELGHLIQKELAIHP
jgi:hypothetical protein